MSIRSPRAASPARLATIAVLLAGALAAGCAKPDAPRMPRVSVTVARAQRRAMPYSLVASGTVEAVQTADVGSQVGGVITRIAFREGQELAAGAPLFELDPRPFRAALAQAMGALARDRAQATSARLEAERAAKLIEQNLMSQSDWDAKRATADGLAGTVQADSATVTNARLNLEYATIRAPIAGRTGRFNVHVGDYVKAATSEPLVTINQLRPIYVRFTVSEDDRAQVQRYRNRQPRVLVRTDPDDSLEIVGRLVFVDNAVDPNTGTLTLKGEFPNHDGRLWPGEFVEVRLELDVQRDALVVPAQAIGNGQQGSYVFVMNADSSATSRPVTVSRSDDAIAIVSKGLEPGEIVITDGQFRLSPGARVIVRGAKAGGRAGGKQ
jgi:multidrug efflux system membrane fusion protein